MEKTNKIEKGEIQIEEAEKQELQEIFSLEKQEDVKDVKIIKDQEQFAVKIPRDFSRELNINPDKHFFRFTLLVSDKDSNKKILHGNLIQNETEEKKD